MKRSTFRPKLPPRAPDARSGEFDSFVPRPRAAAAGPAVVMALCRGPAKPVPKTPERRSQAIRDSAKGEDCTVRLPGVCTFNPEHTIWSHAPLQAAGKGRSIKAIDEAGCYACTACDAVVDGQAPGPERDAALLAWFMGHMRSLVILKQKGLL